LSVQPVATPPVDAAANLRRSIIVGSILGVIGIVVLSVVGHPLAGVFGCVGLALGALNNRMLQQAVLRFAAPDGIDRKQFRQGVLARLTVITLLAIGIGFFVRPDGLAIFLGLALFQILMLIGAALPVFQSLRPGTGLSNK
jgi:hypothetical protein